MNENEELEARINQLEQELKELPRKILSDVKKLITLHTHEVSDKVRWRLPVDLVKQSLGQSKSIKEQVHVRDQVEFKLEPMGEQQNG